MGSTVSSIGDSVQVSVLCGMVLIVLKHCVSDLELDCELPPSNYYKIVRICTQHCALPD